MSARTIMVSSRRSLRAVIGGAASLVISNPDHMKEGSRPTAAELIRVKRHKLPDAHRRPAGHPLHAVRQPVRDAEPKASSCGSAQLTGYTCANPPSTNNSVPVM